MSREDLILNRYRPVEQAGSGKFGQVIAAYDTYLQRIVAIKLIQLSPEAASSLAISLGMGDEEPPAESGSNDGFPADPAFLDDRQRAKPSVFDADARAVAQARLNDKDVPAPKSDLPGLGEAQIAGSLGSPNIVAVYDLQLEGQTAYLVMEYVDGTNLEDFLKTYDSELTLDIIAAVVSGVANALKVAHRKHVLHLDIKPANILISNDGSVKVADFGMAALPSADGSTHGNGGTIGFMPLEQLTQQPLDERCDEWALASVAYLMLMGKNPFEASDVEGAQQAIKNAELIVPSLVWDDLDEEADDILFGALHPDREGRYASVKDFADVFVPLLGKPKRGRVQIAELMETDEEEGDEAGGAEELLDDEDEWEGFRAPLHVRLSPRAKRLIARAFSAFMAAGVSVLAAVRATGSSLFQQGADAAAAATSSASDVSGIVALASWVIVVGVAVASAVFPRLAPLLAYSFLGLALMLNAELLPGIVLIAATIAWWLFAAPPKTGSVTDADKNRLRMASNVSLSEPLAGCVAVGALPSLVAGCCLSPGKATATAAHAFVVAFVLGSLGGQSILSWDFLGLAHISSSGAVTTGFLALAQQPSTWLFAASWILGAAVFSALRSTRRRWLGVVGAVIAGALVVAMPVVAAMLVVDEAGLFVEPWIMASVIVSALAAVALAVALPVEVDEES